MDPHQRDAAGSMHMPFPMLSTPARSSWERRVLGTLASPLHLDRGVHESMRAGHKRSQDALVVPASVRSTAAGAPPPDRRPDGADATAPAAVASRRGLR